MTVLYHAAAPREDISGLAAFPATSPATSPATANPQALWGRIAAHDFQPGHNLNFARRLARDKSWPLAFALSGAAILAGTIYAGPAQPPANASNSSGGGGGDNGGDSGGGD